MTHINPDDPKWTAYALGELNGAERSAVEAELNASEEARMLVADLRFAAQLTKAELRDGQLSRPSPRRSGKPFTAPLLLFGPGAGWLGPWSGCRAWPLQVLLCLPSR